VGTEKPHSKKFNGAETGRYSQASMGRLGAGLDDDDVI